MNNIFTLYLNTNCFKFSLKTQAAHKQPYPTHVPDFVKWSNKTVIFFSNGFDILISQRGQHTIWNNPEIQEFFLSLF